MVLKRCRDRGDVTAEVQFETPVAAAIGRAEREYICDDDLINRAKRRLAEGPEGPDAAEEPDPYDDYDDDEYSDEDDENDDNEGNNGKGFWREDEADSDVETTLLAVPKVTQNRRNERKKNLGWTGLGTIFIYLPFSTPMHSLSRQSSIKFNNYP